MRWFRFYSEVLHDPKVRRLPSRLYKEWVMVLCLANIGKPRGRLPSAEDVADHLGGSTRHAEGLLGRLKERGLLDEIEGRLVPHNWDTRQPPSDNAPERMQSIRRTRSEHPPKKE